MKRLDTVFCRKQKELYIVKHPVGLPKTWTAIANEYL